MAADAKMVRDIAPELKAEDDGRIDTFLGFAALSVNANVWGDKSDLGVAVMAAHLLTLSNRGGVSGAVTSEKVGDLARSYSSTKASDETLMSTSYGSWFIQLRKSLPITPVCL